MLKKHKVVMLSTNQKTNLFLSNFNEQLNLVKQSGYYHTGQHLYFLSDEKIKDNDWCINKNQDTLYQLISGNMANENSKYWTKLIATTDTLSLNYDLHKDSVYLPQPSDSFIQKYIERYNAGNPITEVMIEYNEICHKCNNLRTDKSCCSPVYEYHKNNHELILKINPKDNTITIKSVKESWNREELIGYLGNISQSLINELKVEYPKDFFKNWIEQNL